MLEAHKETCCGAYVGAVGGILDYVSGLFHCWNHAHFICAIALTLKFSYVFNYFKIIVGFAFFRRFFSSDTGVRMSRPLRSTFANRSTASIASGVPNGSPRRES